ncbi:MAG TPA: neocarzinostatin apoprotein domain-containing protein [Acidimicrobiales bacterium]|nr:neocarzinostatin apoprotein domain-containing protein [Acidimicrobiales bacterium]
MARSVNESCAAHAVTDESLESRRAYDVSGINRFIWHRVASSATSSASIAQARESATYGARVEVVRLLTRYSPAPVVAITVALVTASCSSGSGSTPSTTSSPATGVSASASASEQHGVGVLRETLIDESRPTPANGSSPAHAGRTLQTFVFYPAEQHERIAATTDAPPDRSGGPFPLIVFAHGFGESPNLGDYKSLLEHWASAGYVVAAPVFPLTNSAAPGGPDLSDYVNQPADMSFVVTEVVGQSKSPGSLLDGMVNPNEIGAAGHSLGGVTVLGLVTNTCCHDPRIKAAVVMSGDQETFPSGTLEYSAAPPMLLVHGNADVVVPYASSVEVFDAAQAPKGLLTIKGGGHGSPVDPSGPAFATVVSTTIAFFNAYLKGSTAAAQFLDRDPATRVTTLKFVSMKGESAYIPIPTTVTGHLRASVKPSSNLTDGEFVTVSYSGYQPGVSINVLQCSTSPPTQASDCDLHFAKVLQPDPTGRGSISLQVHTGTIGTGTCGPTGHNCVVAVNQGGSLQPSATVEVPISFAG